MLIRCKVIDENYTINKKQHDLTVPVLNNEKRSYRCILCHTPIQIWNV